MDNEEFTEAVKKVRQTLLDKLRGGTFAKSVEPRVAIMACLMLASEMTHVLGEHSSSAFCRVARDVFRTAGRSIASVMRC